MRAFLLFTLAVVGLGVLTGDADAFGRKGRGGAATGYYYSSAGYYPADYSMNYSAGYYSPSQGSCCDGSAVPSSGPALMPSPSSGSLNQDVIRATDGTVYYRGADGTYSMTPQGYADYNTSYNGYSAYSGDYSSGYDTYSPTLVYRSRGLFGRRGGYYYTSPTYSSASYYYTSPSDYYYTTGGYYSPSYYPTTGGYYSSPGVYQTSYPSTTYPGTVVPSGGVPIQMPAPMLRP